MPTTQVGLYTVDETRTLVAFRVFHRTVASDPPMSDAFVSNKAKGLPPRGAEIDDLSLWDGISVMDTLERAIKRARQFPMHGIFVAELSIPPDAPIVATRTLRTPRHYTLHGSPQDLLACVTRVFPIEPQQGIEQQ